MQTIQMPLGELATAHPSATRVFLRHKLDFCCGGRRSLADACRQAGLDPERIAQELEQEAKCDESTRWDQRSQTELADHIEARYHAALRRDMPPLIEAARKVERVHANKPAVPAGLADVLMEFFGEMESHMQKEERILFPWIRNGTRSDAIAMPIRVMVEEHDSHREYLARIVELTDDFVAPPHACATWRALYNGLAAIKADLMEHIHLENNILFPRATHHSL